MLPIHESFYENTASAPAKNMRRTKSNIKNLILNELKDKNLSASAIYRNLGYSGNLSKTFRICIQELIDNSKIRCVEENKNSSNNLITKMK